MPASHTTISDNIDFSIASLATDYAGAGAALG